MCSHIASCVGYSIYHNATQSFNRRCSLSLESRKKMKELVDLNTPGLAYSPKVRWGWRTPARVSFVFVQGTFCSISAMFKKSFCTTVLSHQQLGCAWSGHQFQHNAGLGRVALPREMRTRVAETEVSTRAAAAGSVA